MPPGRGRRAQQVAQGRLGPFRGHQVARRQVDDRHQADEAGEDARPGQQTGQGVDPAQIEVFAID
jgi:hypothetical protein